MYPEEIRLISAVRSKVPFDSNLHLFSTSHIRPSSPPPRRLFTILFQSSSSASLCSCVPSLPSPRFSFISMAAPDLMRRSEIDGQQFAVQEAAAAGLRSMERLVFTLSSPSHKQEDCREIADLTVTKFRNVISLLNRTGHARFRRSPSSSSTPPDLNFSPGSSPVAAQPLQALKPSFLSLDFGKQLAKETFSLPAPISSANSSFISSITGDGSVSNGKQGSSIHVRSALKPPLSSSYKRKCPSHSSSGRCHCAKKRFVYVFLSLSNILTSP